MPWFKCRTPWNAEMTKMDAEVKPFCISPGDYSGRLSDCFPSAELPTSGCEGVYDASDGLADNANLMFARRRQSLPSRDGPVHMVLMGNKCRSMLAGPHTTPLFSLT